MNVLAIGNSFSQDAFSYLHQIAESAGESLACLGLYIGGCPLSHHAENLKTGKAEYHYEENGDTSSEKYGSIEEALTMREWDVISLQQVSHLSGQAETYQPYFDELYAFVTEKCPDAKIVVHETWAYEIDSNHGEFYRYDHDQHKMFDALYTCYHNVAAEKGLALIPVGEVVQALRTHPRFDYENGGASLCRDGFHLSIPHGRYVAGLTWFSVLTGRSATEVPYVVEGIEEADADLLRKTVDQVVFGA